MGKALASVGTAIVVGGLALATGGLALIPAVAGGGLAGALGTAAFGLTASQWIAVGAGLSAVGAATSARPAGSSRDPLEWTADVDAPIPFAFGRVGVAGKIVYASDGYGPDNRYTSIVSVLSGAGPIQSFVSFASNDVVTSLDPTTGEATSGEHTDEMWVQRKLGAQPDTALSSPAGLDGGATVPLWGSTYKLSGKACVMQTLYENSKFTAFPGGEEKPLHVIEGKFGWDPRLDSTWPGGSGPCRLLDPSTWVYIDEGCIAGLNWAIGMWEGSDGEASPTYGVPYACTQVGGIGASLDAIDVEAFIECANIADANGWKLAAWPDTGMDESIVLDKMLQASGAMRSRVAGRISCVTRAASQASVLTVTGADTAGPVELSLGPSRLDRKNAVVPSHPSEAHGWQMIPLSEVSDAAWVTADRGKKRSSGIAFSYVPDPDQAAQLAYLHLADLREPVSGTVPFKPHMRRLAPGDCFTFTEAGFRLDGLKCRVLKRAFDPATGIVKITFRQETDAKYAAAMAQTGTPPGSITPGLPPGDIVDDPTAFTATVDGDEVTLQWTVGEANYFRTLIHISDSNVFSTATQIASQGHVAGATQTFVHKPGPGTWYYWVQGRSYSFELSGAVGPAEAIVTMGTIPSAVADSSNLLRRTGGGLFTGELDAVDGTYVDNSVATLENELVTGTVKPAEAVTFTGKGALAEKNAVDTADITPDAISHYASAFTEANLAYSGSGSDTAQTVSLTTTGGTVEVSASLIFNGNDPTADLTGVLSIERDGVAIWGPYTVCESYETATGSQSLLQTVALTIPDAPAAGAHTWTLKFLYTSGSAKNVRSRFLSVREMKTET